MTKVRSWGSIILDQFVPNPLEGRSKQIVMLSAMGHYADTLQGLVSNLMMVDIIENKMKFAGADMLKPRRL